MDLAEVIRLLENIVRTGTVTEIDEKKWRVRVQSGELDSTWLRWNAQRAGAFSVWVPPSVGEQVWFLSLGGIQPLRSSGEVFTATTIRRQAHRQKK